MSAIKRLALGERAGVGTLYDARQETFLPQSILASNSPGHAVAVTDASRMDLAIVTSDTYREKLNKMGIGRELGASLLADIAQLNGSALYLSEPGHGVTGGHRGAIYTLKTRQERLDFMAVNARDALDLTLLASSTATHVVTEITWGAMAVVSARAAFRSDEMRAEWEQEVEDAFRKAHLGAQDEQDRHISGTWARLDDQMQVKLHVDLPDTINGPVQRFSDALTYIQELEYQVKRMDTGPGTPIMYTLLPIGFFVTLGADIPSDMPVGQLSPECYETLVDTLDHIRHLQLALHSHHQRIIQHLDLVSHSHRETVEAKIRQSGDVLSKLYGEYPSALAQIRNNGAISQTVMKILDDAKAGVLSSEEIIDFVEKADQKLDFLLQMTKLGAIYPAQPVETEEKLLNHYTHQHTIMYVFHFSSTSMNPADPSWTGNSKLLEDTLTRKDGKRAVLLVDCDNYHRLLSQAYMTVYTHGTLVVEDLLQQNEELAEKPLLQYDEALLEATKSVPTYRKAVRIPCPSQYCDRETLEWTCSRCHESVEFGSHDGFFYCDCGRVPYDGVEFHCQRKTHGSAYQSYERRRLQSVLKNLPDPKEVNILIMGETGVGKSTFVNAFINYLTFTSLDDGLKNPTLNWVIPCSFTTQVVGADGRLLSEDVVIGKDTDEADGSSGQSATQKATVYPVYFKDTIIRLIDTPGIGDTRGVDQDKKNMANMLSVLRNYTDLHGILILLKPNNARLGVMFRFCVKELLTHLHTSAAQNMVFGFTNTRGSNYTPGDTFKPLETLLSQYKDVICGLRQSNVYCFDSESFRYLAAKKNGIEMGNLDDYRRSWEHSAKEARRLLDHFQSLHPHHTQQTLSLNETRHLISQLTMPMQQISVAITDTIAKNSQQIRDLRDAELTSTQLKSRLQIHKTAIKATQLSKPKTVCAHDDCVEPYFDEGKQGRVLLRKNLCHNPCCLENVPVGKVGTPELVSCYAFHKSKESCRVCSHHWKEHEHILVEYEKKEETTTDPAVQRELGQTGDVIQAKERTIKQLTDMIAELQQEHTTIQTAAAKFSLYLKHNSITHYNDETVEYMEHLIRDERTKARTSQNRSQLDTLEASLTKYRQFIHAMEQGKGGSKSKQYQPLDERGIAQLVQTLYNLPHYGAMLRGLAQVVGRAYEANFRERPYRISKKRYWKDEKESWAGLWSIRTKKKSPMLLAPSASMRRRPAPGPSKKPDRSEDFWPLADSTPRAPSAVHSIADWWEDEPRAAGVRQAPSSDPPPYSPQDPKPSTLRSAVPAQGSHMSTEIVEKRGTWIRLKNKLKKI